VNLTNAGGGCNQIKDKFTNSPEGYSRSLHYFANLEGKKMMESVIIMKGEKTMIRKPGFKRIFTCVLATLMLMVLVAGCGNSTTPGTNEPQTKPDNTAGTPTTPATQEKPAEIVFALLADNSPRTADAPLIEDAINEITLNKINTKVSLQLYPYSSYDQQITLMQSGNEPLDLIFVTNANYSSYVSRNQLLQLDELIDKYGAGIREALGDYLDATAIDGKLYIVPTIRDLAKYYAVNMRKDLVDKYNIDTSAIKDIYDLTPILKKVKEGEGADFYPLVTAAAGRSILSYYVKYDPLGDAIGVLLNDGLDNTKVVLYEETEEYRELVKLVHDWYEAGYIMRDITTTQEGYSSLLKAGKGFAYLNGAKAGYAEQATRNVGAPILTIPLTPTIANTASVTQVNWGISVTSKYPDAATKYLNLMYSDKDLVTLLCWGIEGKHYKIYEDGFAYYPEGVDGDSSGWTLNMGYAMGNQFLSPLWRGEQPNLWEQMKKDNDTALRSKALGFTFNSENVKTELAAVNSVRSQYRMLIECGLADPDSGIIEEYVAKMKEAGVDKIIAEKQAQLDAWLAKK